MKSIRGMTKAERIKWDAPVNYTSWAYMKQLREHNDTGKVYAVDPYIEVYQFRENLYSLFHPNCDGMGDVWMHLIIGPERAMLIDTGYGLGDLKGLCEELIGGRKLIVVNTHDHFDHAYGNCRFDKVFCSEFNVPYLENQHEHMWDYLFDAFGNNIWLKFDRKDLPKYRNYEIIGVPDGYVWNLGEDYEIELIDTGGHAEGHAAFLDKKDRILFPGDNISSDTCYCGNINFSREQGPYYEHTYLSYYREHLKAIVDRTDEYDSVFPQHFMLDLDAGVMADTLDAVDQILIDPIGNADYKTEEWRKERKGSMVTYFKNIRSFSVIKYHVGKQ